MNEYIREGKLLQSHFDYMNNLETNKIMKTANQILSECGINTMSLNDEFNTQLFHAMEEYAELKFIDIKSYLSKLEKQHSQFVNIIEQIRQLALSGYMSDGWKRVIEIISEFPNDK